MSGPGNASVAPNPVQTGDFILVHFLTDQPKGLEFLKQRNDWPLLVTLLTWFKISDSLLLRHSLSEFAEQTASFEVIVGGVEQFGNAATVSVIATQQIVATLHNRLYHIVTEQGGVLRDKRWIGEQYNAHITHHVGADLPPESSLRIISDVSLVELLPAGVCRVVETFKLGAA